MKKFALSMLASLCVGASASLYADVYSDFKDYDAGKSLAWYYDLCKSSLSKQNAGQIEKRLLNIVANEKISDAAFNRACEILKVIGTEDSVAVLAKFLNDDVRCAWVCNVLLAIDDGDADEILAAKLPTLNAKNQMSVMSTLAQMGDDDAIDDIAKIAESNDKELAKFAVLALAKFVDDDAVEALSAIAKKADFRQKTAFEALSMIAFKAVKKGDKSLAREALECVPEDFGMSIVARAELAKNKMKYIDSLIIADGTNVDEAGRAAYNNRKFEDSAEITAAFEKLSKKAKLAAISSFMLSGDTRFYPTIAPLLDSQDSDLRDEAIYAARFICTDRENLLKIYPLLTDSRRVTKGLARNVFEENPSFAAAKILKEKADAGDMLALEILIKRGDVEARDKLMKMYFDGGYENSKISSLLENVIVAGELPVLAVYLKNGDEKLRKDIAKIIIKKLAKTRDKLYMGEAAYEILNGKIEKSDPIYKFIESKIRTKIRARKNVWQGEYRIRAVEDSAMKVATFPEPDLKNDFVSLFDGKTLNGWKTTTGNAKYEVKDGCILGTTDPKMKQNSFLVTERANYKNFIFTCEFKWVDFGNSGVIFRGYFNENGKVVGPQAEMDDDPKRRWSAGIYNEGSQWKYSLSREDQEDARNAVDLNGWNRMTIECVGNTTRTWLNGVPVSDLDWAGDKSEGFIGLQIHSGKKGKVLWRNIKIKEVK